jgi:hypothetical protein
MADRRGRVQRHQVRHGVLPRAGRRLQRYASFFFFHLVSAVSTCYQRRCELCRSLSQRRHHRDRAGLHQPQVLRRRRRLRRGPGTRSGAEPARI